MSRNRSNTLESRQPLVSNISSNIPLMPTDKNDHKSFLTQSLMNVNLVPDRSILLQALPLDSIRDTRRSRTVCQPKGTIMYTVDENDTLEKVALRFDSTPSELLQLNKLNARMLFPGQTLYVPENCSSDETTDLQELTTTISSPPVSTLSSISSKRNKDSEAFILVTDRRHSNTSTPSPRSSLYSETQYDVGPMVWSMSKQSAARPGRVHRLISNPSTENESSSKTSEEDLKTQNVSNNEQVNLIQDFLPVAEHHQLDDECLQRFIKVTVRLMTEDHQSIAGTLLVTPNAVMFDPDVLDPLVKEYGIDKYGLIIRMNLLAGIALYDDLAIYEHKATSRDEEKRKMCHSTSVKHAHYCSTNKTLNSDEEEIQQLMSSLLDQIDKEFNPSASDDTCCMLFNAATSTIQRHLSKDSTENSYNDEDDDDDDPTYLPTEIIDNSLQYSNDLFQALDDYKHSIGILSDDKNVNKNFNRVPSQISYGFDWKRFRRAVKIKKGCHLENCVPVDEFNKRFGEIDKLLHQQQQILCAPRPIEIPYYLCIKTSEPACDKPSLYARQYRKDTEKLIDNAYGKKQLEQEYWFLIPKEKIDELYVFFLRWTPEHESNPLTDEDQQPPNLEQSKQNDKSGNKGFVLLANDGPELNDNYSKSKNQKKSPEQKKPHYLSRQNTLLREWEIVSLDEIYRRNHATHPDDINSYDIDGIPAPKLLQTSILINEELSKQILRELPPRLHSRDWYMIFSTEENGFSLSTLYRRSFEIDHDSPSLIIIKDVEQNIFGAFVPHQLLISEGFYGTGESFLFTLHPEFRVFNWSGDNEFFVKGDVNSLGFGIGEGTYALWLDGNLYRGRSCATKTFNNEILSSNEDFIIASIEVWTFTG